MASSVLSCTQFLSPTRADFYHAPVSGFVGVCLQPWRPPDSIPPRNIEFTFNIFQSYVRWNSAEELQYAGRRQRRLYVTETPFALTGGKSNSNPAVLSGSGQQFQDRRLDIAGLENVGGMFQLNEATRSS